MEITKIFTFDSAHRLPWHEGKCKNIHGHTYTLHITVKGELDKNGIVIDFGDLKDIVKKNVIEKLDHNDLNNVIDNPTAENLACWIWDQLINELSGLSKVTLWETPTSYVTYNGI